MLSILVVVSRTVLGFGVLKRQIAPENNAEHLAIANNPMQINYDEYPLVVPKRAAILLDRLMVALHHALEDEKNGSRKIADVYGRRNQVEKTKTFQGIRNENYIPNFTNELTSDHIDIYSELPEDMDTRDLPQMDNRQFDGARRGQDADSNVGINKGRIYWRCYFNAVTCF